MFGRATIRLGIGPHSSLSLDFLIDLDLLFNAFANKPRDSLGRMSPKWPILCRVGRKTFTKSINHCDFGVCKC